MARTKTSPHDAAARKLRIPSRGQLRAAANAARMTCAPFRPVDPLAEESEEEVSEEECEEEREEVWQYCKELKMVLHTPLCPVCRRWITHYASSVVDPDQSLEAAIESRDQLPTVRRLEEEREQAVQRLAEMRTKLSEARAKLKQAREDRASVVNASKAKRRLPEESSNFAIGKLRHDLEARRRPSSNPPSTTSAVPRTHPPA